MDPTQTCELYGPHTNGVKPGALEKGKQFLFHIVESGRGKNKTFVEEKVRSHKFMHIRFETHSNPQVMRERNERKLSSGPDETLLMV